MKPPTHVDCFKFSDEPVLWIREKLRERRMNRLREAIEQKWQHSIPSTLYWIKDVKGEHDGLCVDEQAMVAQKNTPKSVRPVCS